MVLQQKEQSKFHAKIIIFPGIMGHAIIWKSDKLSFYKVYYDEKLVIPKYVIKQL